WTMYRGWYKGQREWGSAKVPWEFCLAEWNAQFFGDRAYQISEAEKANLRWEARQFRAGNLWHRWDYPNPVGSDRFDECYTAFERSDWLATPAAEALIRNNRPLLAYIAGKPGAFTSKDHNFLPGETIEKQIIVINNSRQSVPCEVAWSFNLPQTITGKRQVT